MTFHPTISKEPEEFFSLKFNWSLTQIAAGAYHDYRWKKLSLWAKNKPFYLLNFGLYTKPGVSHCRSESSGKYYIECFVDPPLGLRGAAISTAFTTVFWNITMLAYVQQRIGINAIVAVFKGQA